MSGKGDIIMQMLLHDLTDDIVEDLLRDNTDINFVISDNGTIQSCIGCFGCWVKTPGICVLKDKYSDTGAKLAICDRFIIISKCYYGGFSPFVKNVIDRAISYIHPYFIIRKGEMHHKRRYKNHLDLEVWLYGSDITEDEKETANKLVQANAVNFDGSVESVEFIENPIDISIKKI